MNRDSSTRHVTEDDLVLLYYREHESADEILAHLQECGRCRAEDECLRSALAAVRDAPVPSPSETYGQDVWERIRPVVEGGSPRDRRVLRLGALRSWQGLAAAAVLVVAAFVAGRAWPRPETAPVAPGPPGLATGRILLVAVGDHLERSQIVLAEIVNRPPGDDLIVTPLDAADFVAANRIVRQSAERAGETALAAVLDDLERVFVDLANAPPDSAAGELDRVKERIETDDLLFKVRVVRTTVEHREREPEPGL
jgi:hypothetical protein